MKTLQNLFLVFSLFLPYLWSEEVVKQKKYDHKMDLYRSRISKKFIHEKSQENGIIQLSNGVLVEILRSSISSTAKSPRAQDKCKVSFIIKNPEGDILENSKMILQPREVPHQSWGKIFTYMAVGDLWRVYIPSDLAYGAEGQLERNILPHTPIIVDLEVFVVMGEGKSRNEARKAFLEAQVKSPLENNDDGGAKKDPPVAEL